MSSMEKNIEGAVEKKTVTRQLAIPKDPYNDMEQLRIDIQKEHGKKPSSQDLLVELIVDGLKYRKQEHPEFENVVTQFNKWFSLTREDIGNIKEQVMSGISSGKIDIKSIFVAITAFERVFVGDKDNPGIKSLIMPYVSKDLKRDPGPVTIGNFEIRTEENKSYDYSSDPQWQMMRTEENVAAEKRRGREDFLKAVNELQTLDGSHESIEGIPYRVQPPKVKPTTKVIVKLTK
jgi:hypothetical protein